jgi:HrpA-like RNA helicase
MIDFCLQRKISTNNGILKLQTKLASKSNLIQRRGRIGRNMDGICVRMINEKLY